MHRLKNTLVELAGALGHPVDDASAAAFDAKLAEDELAADEAAPDWLVAFLQCIARRVHTPTWAPFELNGREASNSFDFIRGLDRIVPVRVVNDEERWTIVADAIGHEGVISFEGYLYLTKPIGAPEPGETDIVRGERTGRRRNRTNVDLGAARQIRRDFSPSEDGRTLTLASRAARI